MGKARPGVFIRSPEKVGPSYADPGSSSMNGPRTVNGKVVSSRGRGDGSKSRMYPSCIKTIDLVYTWDPIDVGDLQLPINHQINQEQEAPMQEQPVQEQPLQEQPVQRRPVQQPVQRKSERIAQILFNKPPTPGPGLDPDDAISIE
ncbi:hypothetical protein Tco_1029567 [Tanacetum coccineum]|uniref:Uncharacterized protein n=1 Tax=Tanacetum coccineum TaxID=301880 RepID=A0ABQ5G417_9ASTR